MEWKETKALLSRLETRLKSHLWIMIDQDERLIAGLVMELNT